MLLGFDALAPPDRIYAGNEFTEGQNGRLCDKNISRGLDSRMFALRLSSCCDNRTLFRFSKDNETQLDGILTTRGIPSSSQTGNRSSAL